MAKKKTVRVNGEDWTLERVRELIETNPDARLKALMVIYSYQTEHEKGCGHNSEYNGVGFNKIDVERLTSTAQWFVRNGFVQKIGPHKYKLVEGKHMTQKQDDFLYWKMPKYSKQIFKHMERMNAVKA